MNKIAPRPLPPCPEIFPAGSDLRKAFRVCNALESKERWDSFKADLVHTRAEGIPRELTPTCAARVLGFALLYSPSDRGRDNLAAEILKCNDNENDHELLGWLAHLYVYGLIRLFYSPREDPPATWIEESPLVSVQESAVELEHLLEKPSLTAGELKGLITIRERGFCPFTGRVDHRLFIQERVGEPDAMELALIVRQSRSEGIKGISEEACQKFNWAKTAGAIIEHFGGFPTRVLLGYKNFNSPRNAMMVAPVVHSLFDELEIWLTPFEDHGEIITDKYKVNFVHDYSKFLTSATFQTYTFPNGKKIEPPSPQLIALHAACAKIVHTSGTAKHLRETFGDTELFQL